MALTGKQLGTLAVVTGLALGGLTVVVWLAYRHGKAVGGVEGTFAGRVDETRRTNAFQRVMGVQQRLSTLSHPPGIWIPVPGTKGSVQ